MNNVRSILKIFFLMGMLLAFAAYMGCKDDEEEVDPRIQQLIGVWTVTDVDVETDIGGQSIKDFLVNVGGMTEIEASAIETLIESMIGTNFTGTLDIKENNTYATTFGGGFDDGSWSINSAGDKITIDAGTVDEMVINIISITDNTLVASTDFVESVDLDNDAQTPDVDVNISILLTFTK